MTQTQLPSAADAGGATAGTLRLQSIDAFRGVTIFAMIFVLQVATYHDLPASFRQGTSVPVSTFKHAGEEADGTDWPSAQAGARAAGHEVQRAVVSGQHADGTYDIRVIDEDARTTPGVREHHHVSVVHSHRVRIGDVVLAQGTTAAAGLGAPVLQAVRGVGSGCTMTDLVAPFFLFIVGLCIPLGRGARALGPAAWRAAKLIAAGVVYISLILGLSYWWGILQTIGVAYWMGVLSLRLRPWMRVAAGVAIGALHGVLSWHVPWWVQLGQRGVPFLTVANLHGDPLRPLTVHCTPWASLSYGVLAMLGTVLGAAVQRGQRREIVRVGLTLGLAFSGLGWGLHACGLPMNKGDVSPAYVFFTSGLASLLFVALYTLIDIWGLRRWAWVFCVLGENALLAYFIQPVVRLLMGALGLYPLFARKAGWVGVGYGLLWTMILWGIVRACNQRRLYWKL